MAHAFYFPRGHSPASVVTHAVAQDAHLAGDPSIYGAPANSMCTNKQSRVQLCPEEHRLDFTAGKGRVYKVRIWGFSIITY